MTGAAISSDGAGFAALKQRLADLPENLRGEVAGALESIGDELVADARQRLAASAPSGPPAEDRPGAVWEGSAADPTGGLAASLGCSLDAEAMLVSVTASSPHAIFLEYGTRKMAPRPFLRPALEAVGQAARAHLRDVLARALAGSGSGS